MEERAESQVVRLRAKRTRRRWPFVVGRFRQRGEIREAVVIDIAAYRRRRRPVLPVTAVLDTRGEPA